MEIAKEWGYKFEEWEDLPGHLKSLYRYQATMKSIKEKHEIEKAKGGRK